ncbi:hypothetical protein BZA70DRAFT_312754 [Myxozyma melibiosi]|uniref:Uncharacterized protein n=1 Tax=Myxozyma melibiosi TaxID=54550 RepID=A0ABR1EZA1_9ASCO
MSTFLEAYNALCSDYRDYMDSLEYFRPEIYHRSDMLPGSDLLLNVRRRVTDVVSMIQEQESSLRDSWLSPASLGRTILSLSPKALNPSDNRADSVVVAIYHDENLFFYSAQGYEETYGGRHHDHFKNIQDMAYIVRKFGHSSFLMNITTMDSEVHWKRSFFPTNDEYYRSAERAFQAANKIPDDKNIDCGGDFPLLDNDGHLVGAVCVSGLGDAENHDLVVRGIKKYLHKAEEVPQKTEEVLQETEKKSESEYEMVEEYTVLIITSIMVEE